MPQCFVIQPFDGGRFDKRYKDVFAPAIMAAGLEPYRVDADPSVSIPIDDIESGIKRAEMCFVDITLDNPNVWFELGYALAAEKEICLVCSEERTTKFPFDVQHRTIIKYGVESPSDYDLLEQKITQRLKAIQTKTTNLLTLRLESPIREDNELTQHEMMVLATIMENRNGPSDRVSHSIVKEDLNRLGYNNLALNIGVERLLYKNLISHDQVSYDDDSYAVYSLTTDGVRWVTENYERLNLGVSRPSSRAKKIIDPLDDEIPF